MSGKQLIPLFLCNAVPAIVGISILALLPVYAVDLGASEAMTGFLISLAFAMLAFGSLISGWLSDRFQRRRLTIMIVGVLGLVATFCMGQVDQIEALTILMMITWFAGGVTGATVNILVGIHARPETRGRTFGIIGAGVGFAQIIGGFGSGTIVDRWGFTALFTVVALVWLIQIIAILFFADRVRVDPPASNITTAPTPLPAILWLLMLAHLLVATIDSSAGLGRPLRMDRLGFDATTITSAIAISGLVSLPLPILAGWLSDRLGRTRLLIGCYLAVGLGAMTLAAATDLWHFWLSTGLITTSMAGLSVGLALVNDLVTTDAVAKAVSRLLVIPWIAGIVGFGTSGLVVNKLGLQTTFMGLALFPLISIMLILIIERSIRTRSASYAAP